MVSRVESVRGVLLLKMVRAGRTSPSWVTHKATVRYLFQSLYVVRTMMLFLPFLSRSWFGIMSKYGCIEEFHPCFLLFQISLSRQSWVQNVVTFSTVPGNSCARDIFIRSTSLWRSLNFAPIHQRL